jgi:hypothetical protein
MLEFSRVLVPRRRGIVLMFWKRRQSETPEGRTEPPGPLADPPQTSAARPLAETIEIERDASRAASISRVAEELGRRGEEVVELFEEISSSTGWEAVMPIHLRRGGEDVFVEVETGPWERETVESVLKAAAVLRGSKYSDAPLEILGAYTVPHEVLYFCGRSPAIQFQLDLVLHDDAEDAKACAQGFKEAAKRHWDLDLDYDPEGLPLIEEQLLGALGERSGGGARAPILDALVRGYGCYVGETLRRNIKPQGSWRSVANWGDEGLVVEFPDATADPIGKARVFLENGPEDSAAYYVSYAIEELNDSSKS